MKVRWTRSAAQDLDRLHAFLKPAAPDAAARVIRELVRAPGRLLEFSRLGERLEGFDPREVRRIIVGRYELRYEVADAEIIVLRLWHCRENRNFGAGE